MNTVFAYTFYSNVWPYKISLKLFTDLIILLVQATWYLVPVRDQVTSLQINIKFSNKAVSNFL